MNIELKNKFLYYEKYKLRCSIGKRGISNKKKEGDKKTPKGEFKLKYILYRKDRVFDLQTKLKKIKIDKKMGWCDDPKSIYYNKIIKINDNCSHEKLIRRDKKYDLLIPIKYNFDNSISGKGSCIFLHLTKNYKPTAGCIALKKKDFEILLKLVDKKTKIKIG